MELYSQSRVTVPRYSSLCTSRLGWPQKFRQNTESYVAADIRAVVRALRPAPHIGPFHVDIYAPLVHLSKSYYQIYWLALAPDTKIWMGTRRKKLARAPPPPEGFFAIARRY